MASWLRESVSPLRKAGQEGYRPTVVERRRLAVVGAVLVLVGALAVGGLGPLILLAAAGPSAIWAIVERRRRRYLSRVERDLPEISDAIADALAGGASLRAALCEVGRSLRGPSSREFTRIQVDLETGASTSRALRTLAARIDSERAGSLAALLIAGAGSGADLVSLLRRFGESNLDRNLAVRDARSSTAQARYTGTMVVALPVGAALFAELVQPGFFASVLSSTGSTLLLAASLLLQVVGLGLVRYLARSGSK